MLERGAVPAPGIVDVPGRLGRADGGGVPILLAAGALPPGRPVAEVDGSGAGAAADGAERRPKPKKPEDPPGAAAGGAVDRPPKPGLGELLGGALGRVLRKPPKPPKPPLGRLLRPPKPPKPLLRPPPNPPLRPPPKPPKPRAAITSTGSKINSSANSTSGFDRMLGPLGYAPATPAKRLLARL
jgi:hypothetical protein